jgi:hypothetical protein
VFSIYYDATSESRQKIDFRHNAFFAEKFHCLFVEYSKKAMLSVAADSKAVCTIGTDCFLMCYRGRET